MVSSTDQVEVEEEQGTITTTPAEVIGKAGQQERTAFDLKSSNSHDADDHSRRRKASASMQLNETAHLAIQANQAGHDAIQINAPIGENSLLNIYNYNASQSLLGNLTVEPHQNITANDTARRILKKRAQFVERKRAKVC